MGAITSGPAFARAAAVAGYATVLEDVSREMLGRGVEWIRESLRGDVTRGLAGHEVAEAGLRRTATARTVEDAIRSADLIGWVMESEVRRGGAEDGRGSFGGWRMLRAFRKRKSMRITQRH